MSTRRKEGLTAAVAEVQRLTARARHHYRSGGGREALTRGLEKLVVYGSYQIERVRTAETFVFHDRRYAYFAHPYNATWRNERAVEVPLAREFLARFPGGVGLEVGNVMSHYGPIRHTVLDKYEADPRVVAVDVVDFHPPQRFDYILSISTLEHVGRDEVPCEPEKSPRALAHLRALVQPDGRLFVTCPLGYNPALDRAVLESSPVPLVEGFLRRQATANRFDEIDKESAGRLLASSQKCSLLWIAEFGAVAGRQNDS